MFQFRSSVETILLKAAGMSRIFVICTPKGILNELLKILSNSEDLDSKEFVFIYTDIFSESFQENHSLLVDKSISYHLPSLFVISWTKTKTDKMEPIIKTSKVNTYQLSKALHRT